MKITLERKNQAFHFEAVNEAGSTLSLDAKPVIGGENKGFRPMETLLAGLAGCSAIDIGLILKKQRQELEGCSIVVTARRVDAVPSIFEKIHLTFQFTGQLDSDKVAKAIALSLDKYCSVAAIISKTAEITHSFSINNYTHVANS